MQYLIGIDIGTSATKTVLFDEDCRVIASASEEYPLYQPENGWAEQKAEDWRDAVLKTLKEVMELSGGLEACRPRNPHHCSEKVRCTGQ